MGNAMINIFSDLLKELLRRFAETPKSQQHTAYEKEI